MISRRSFFGRFASGLAGAALAVNLELRSLVPIPALPPPAWWYLVEEAIHGNLRFVRSRVFWVREDQLPALGLTHEDFKDSWEELPEVAKIPASGISIKKNQRGVV